MILKHTNEEKILSYLLFASKCVFAFVFFFNQNFQAQLTFSESRSVYLENDGLIHLSDSVSAKKMSIAKVCIPSGCQYSNAEMQNNFKVADVHSLENKKSKCEKLLPLELVKTKLKKEINQQITHKKEKSPLLQNSFSIPKPTDYLFFGNIVFKVISDFSQLDGNLFTYSEALKSNFAFSWRYLFCNSCENNELITAQKKYDLSVRPPPFLA